ncbi:transcription factor IIA subunit alpha, partial [Mycoemilia scoparia]
STIYRHVIDDVIRNVQRDFEDSGVDPSVLEELQRSWETKVIQSRVAIFPNEERDGEGGDGEDNSRGGEHGSGEHAGASNTNSTSYTQSRPQNAASLAAIINTTDSDTPSAAALASLAQSGNNHLLNDDGIGYGDSSHASTSRPPAYMPDQSPYTFSNAYNNNDSNSGHGAQDNIPQTDGANDYLNGLDQLSQKDAEALWNKLKQRPQISQLDGDSYPNTEQQQQQQQQQEEVRLVSDSEIIGSDLDDSDGDDGEADDTDHIVLCQYDKVTRTKNRWKCILKDGIILVNGRDFLFFKATGDFEW